MCQARVGDNCELQTRLRIFERLSLESLGVGVPTVHLGCRLHCSSLHSQFEAFAGMAQGILGFVHVWRVPCARVVLAEWLCRRARFEERHRTLQRVFARICTILTGSTLRSMPRTFGDEFHLLSRSAPCCCPVLVSCSRQY